MGNRSYVQINGDDIFESNNSLPVFWIIGTLSTLEMKYREIKKMDMSFLIHGDDNDDDSYNSWFIENKVGIIEVDIETYLAELESRILYFEKKYPKLVFAYLSYIQFFKKDFKKNKKSVITIEFTEYLNFFDNHMMFYDELLKLKQQINNGTFIDLLGYPNNDIEEKNYDILAFTVGFDDYLVATESQITSKILENWENEQIKIERDSNLVTKTKTKWIQLFFCILWFVAAALILVLYQNNSLSNSFSVPKILAWLYDAIGIVPASIVQIVITFIGIFDALPRKIKT